MNDAPSGGVSSGTSAGRARGSGVPRPHRARATRAARFRRMELILGPVSHLRRLPLSSPQGRPRVSQRFDVETGVAGASHRPPNGRAARRAPNGGACAAAAAAAPDLVSRAAPPSSLDEAAPTERDSVRAPVSEQMPNRRDSVPLLFGCSALDRELVRETGGSARTHELDGNNQRLRCQRLSAMQ